MYPETDRVPFTLERIVPVETVETLGGKQVRLLHHESKGETIHISQRELVDFLSVLNPALYYALGFYLRGCENPSYVLVEYYKAVEAIRHVFGGEGPFLDALKPFGVVRDEYKTFARNSNDVETEPLDIGRHAPKPDAELYAVDLRNMLVQPRSRDVIEQATTLCRAVVDGDWIGKRVKTRRPLQNGYVTIAAGSKGTVTYALGGLSIDMDPCKHCGMGARISRVEASDVELAP
jgi:hypothetical protein